MIILVSPGVEVVFKKFSAIFLSFENDEKVLEKTIAPGNPSFLLAKKYWILSISILDNLVPLYSLSFEAKGNEFNFTPSYNTLIYGK